MLQGFWTPIAKLDPEYPGNLANEQPTHTHGTTTARGRPPRAAQGLCICAPIQCTPPWPWTRFVRGDVHICASLGVAKGGSRSYRPSTPALPQPSGPGVPCGQDRARSIETDVARVGVERVDRIQKSRLEFAVCRCRAAWDTARAIYIVGYNTYMRMFAVREYHRRGARTRAPHFEARVHIHAARSYVLVLVHTRGTFCAICPTPSQRPRHCH